MIERIVEKLEEANLAYRNGNAIMTDGDYDQMVELLFEYDPTNDFFNKIGIEVIDESRKVKLPIAMASMNKMKTIQEIKDWLRLKGISTKVEIVASPKFDGLSLCVNEELNTATTRGDGTYGQKSDAHYKLIGNHLYEDILDYGDPFAPIAFKYTYGEVIMPKKVFNDKYSKWEGTGKFSNPRNLVAGLINTPDATEALADCNYIKYGAVPNKGFNFVKKSDIFDELNRNQRVKVNYHIFIAEDITESLLIALFNKWSEEYEIDGLILEVNDLSLQEKLGRETSTNNPVWARAFKHDSFEQKVQTTILEIEDNISKQGLIKPVAIVEPILIDGVMVSRCTLNNYKFVKDNGLGKGAKVVIKRSGMVIPKIVEVLESVEFVMPTIEGVEIGWNDAGIELITLTETDEQKIKKNIAFFEILGADNVGKGIITLLYNNGHKTIENILSIEKNYLEKIEGFGKRRASIIFDSIRKSITDVELSKVMHGSGKFIGLGSKKLQLVEHFITKPTLEQVMSIEGFAETSAKSFIDNYDDFYDFYKKLTNLTIKKEQCKSSNILEGKSFCFTGIRLPEYEKKIIENGGKISSGVSKTLTYLVCKDINSGSSKLTKAISLGVILLDLQKIDELICELGI